MTGLTRDAFLGGRVQLWQPAGGYRSGVDAVLLAAAVPAVPGQSVLELGSGVGAAILCLAARVPGLRLTTVELQAAYADLARDNAAEAGVAMAVHTADLRAMPPELRSVSFDHVIANPPYFHHGARTPSRDPARDTALAEAAALADWVDVATRRLAPGGCLTLIQHIARLPEVLSALDDRMGAVEVLPLAPRAERAPGLFILRAVKGRRSPFRLHTPLVMHRGDAHYGDGESHTEAISEVLRNAAPLPGFLSRQGKADGG